MQNMDRWSYPETLEREDWLIATYFVELPPSASILEAAQGIAISQTTGSWVKLPDEMMRLVDTFSGRFEGVYRIPPSELKTNPDQPVWCVMRIAFPVQNFNQDLTILLHGLAGNEAAISQKLKLLDIQFPPKLLEHLPGPRFGVQGIRDRLGVYDRPLLLSVIKPCIGLSPEDGAKIAYEAALGGVDLIKDDEKLPNLPVSPIEKRVKAYLAALHRAEEETGQKTIYITNITSQSSKLRENALRARDAGAEMLLANFLSVGLTSLQALAEDPEINLPLLTHFSLGQVWYTSPDNGMSAFLILGKLPRLAGADMVVHLLPSDKYTVDLDTFKMSARALTMPLTGIKPAMPLVGGGGHPGMVPRLVQDLGIDFVAGIGGAIQAHPQGPIAGARAMRQAFDAVTRNIPLEEYAADRVELKIALDKWRDLVY